MVGVACGDRLSSTIACFCSSVHRRRRSTPVITSIRRGRALIGAVVGPLRSGDGPASAGVDSVSIIMDVGDHRPGPKGYVGSGRRLRTAEQWINEGKNAVKWTRLSCRSMAANGVRLRLHALAYNLSNFMRTLALPGE